MERNIQFHALLKDELTYEVKIRSETPASTVDALRKQLRVLVVEAPSEDILETSLAADTELDIVARKIDDLSSFVAKYSESKERYALSRAKALGYHIYHRLARIQPEEDDQALLLTKCSLQSRLESLLAEIEGPLAGTTAPVCAAEGSNPSASASAGSSEMPIDSFREMRVQCSSDLNISKWQVKFNGLTDPRSFLERVEELKEANGVSDSKLFKAAPHLFIDGALLWFRGIKSSVSSWQELKSLLLDEFVPGDYDFRLKQEIQARTQGENEPIHLYFAVMSGMFARLKSDLPEEAKLDILLHNIRPHFTQQLALVDIHSVAELKTYCRKVEFSQQRAKLFVEPPKVSEHTLCRDHVYKASSSKHQQVNAIAEKQSFARKSDGSVPQCNTLQQRKQHLLQKFCQVLPYRTNTEIVRFFFVFC
ncbi:uncharacterized protein LOC125235722 [Leguminivora glycinivorella]|uniref:uncharacterized protein LOC125235722 n=1 Tax=Leguminivora glycinivorella TaxID=1035111 RepID=UPI00200D7A7E|nr:uncharacterized protein LOC125235722 [Leguminivora glycinivorella]